MKYTITVFTENKPGVLNRISALLLRRKINVETLTVSTTERENISRFTIVMNIESTQVEKVVKQIYKVIEVIEVYESIDEDLVLKEIALYKVKAPTDQKRKEVRTVVSLLDAKIVHIEPHYICVQKTGSESDIDHTFRLLAPFGIIEFIRSGRIAMRKK